MKFCFIFTWNSKEIVFLTLTFHVLSVLCQDYCIETGYTPENGFRKPPISPGQPYFKGAVLRYTCNVFYTLTPNVVQECRENNGVLGWDPPKPPTCEKLTYCWGRLVVENGFYDQQQAIQSGTVVNAEDVTCNLEYIHDLSIPYATCTSNGTWSNSLRCTATAFPMCSPPDDIKLGSYEPINAHYPVGSNITYHCSDGSLPQPQKDATRQCLGNLTWCGSAPKCITSTTATASHMYCSRPDYLENGVITCCSGSGSPSAPNYCCPDEGKVMFKCDPGFVLNGEPEWKCSASGYWQHSTEPLCKQAATSASPHLEESSMSDGMMRTVVGVAAGVLGLLLVVVALAFCKPRLKDIKRRWRDFREDENELIINGQRFTLPTYEEAITYNDQAWCDSNTQIATPNCLNALSRPPVQDNLTSPPQSNTTGDLTVLQAGTSLTSPVLLSAAPDSLSGFSSPGFQDPGPSTDPGTLGKPLPSQHDLAIDTFLQEVSSTSREAPSSEICGFDDNFVSNVEHQRAIVRSPTLSESSTESASAPLLSSGRDVTRRPPEKRLRHQTLDESHIEVDEPVSCNSALSEANAEQRTRDDVTPDDVIKSSKRDTFTVTIQPELNTTRGSAEFCETDSFHTDSTDSTSV